jgi:hypothetical protein
MMKKHYRPLSAAVSEQKKDAAPISVVIVVPHVTMTRRNNIQHHPRATATTTTTKVSIQVGKPARTRKIASLPFKAKRLHSSDEILFFVFLSHSLFLGFRRICRTSLGGRFFCFPSCLPSIHFIFT